MIWTYQAIAKTIDHALLLPAMTEAELIAGCALARSYDVATVCIKPYAVSLAVAELQDSSVQVGTVVGFPHGGQATAIKVAEAIEAIEQGAREIDIVINIGLAVGGQWAQVAREIDQLTAACHQRHAIIKVIFETSYLSDQQKIELCRICGNIKVDYVKTSTGFGSAGATVSDIQLMRAHSPAHVRIKASGGIKNLDAAVNYVELGCDRLGTSRTAEILDELGSQTGQPGRNTESKAASKDDTY